MVEEAVGGDGERKEGNWSGKRAPLIVAFSDNSRRTFQPPSGEPPLILVSCVAALPVGQRSVSRCARA